MFDSALSLLDQFVATPADRIVASAVVAVSLAAVIWLVRRSLDWARERIGVGAANAAAGVLILGATVLASAVLLRVWAASPGVSATLSQIKTRGWLFGAQAVLTLVLFSAVYVVTRLVRRGMSEFAEGRQGISKHQIEVAFRTGQVTLYAFALIVVLSIWGVNLGGLLVGAGFLGIVVGMAARQTLGALLAGFVLMFSRPFEIGDWVVVGENEGVVTDITIVNTRIQTFDGEYVMVPNDLVASNEVVNRSRKGRLRLQIEVGVDYATDLDRAMDVAEGALRNVEKILSVPQPQVVAKSFGDSAVVLGLRVWIDKPSARRRWRARTAVIREVKAAFDEEDIKIPFPQREMSGRAETGGFRVADARVEDE
ncbi:MAG: mechanosensitive ion channel family protein [Halobacteriaceae archaeon]